MTSLTDMLSKFVNSNTASTSGSGTLPSNTITNSKVDLKGISTRSGVAYQGPTIPTTTSPSKVVERETEPVVDPVSALMPNPKPSIPYPSRRNDEKRHEKANDQVEKFYKIFQDMSFEISLVDALILMPKFASTFKALIRNKEKLIKMARTPLNEHCSAVILNKLPVIISKDLSVEEKAALIKVLKSHKRAIAWKLSDIKGINPEFCTHKILMEED
ncbi:hypothetical protein Tco_0574450 [Tanacetum coccineum]